MARHVRIDREPWETLCGKCHSPLTVPWYWAPSKYARVRNLCESCHDKKLATERLASEMYRNASRQA